MSRARPFIIALDGPSDTGKSTLAQGLRESFGAEVLVLPCYADLAGPEQPSARGDDDEEQLRGLEFYLTLDRRRRGMAAGAGQEAIVIADRSELGLLAHAYAIERTGGPAAYEQARARVIEHADGLLVPDLVLYLALDSDSRRARRETADKDAWFTEEALNEQINRFFTSEAPRLFPGVVEQLDAAPAAPEVLRQAQRIILQRIQSSA
jgi:thymidylate kinase